MKQPKLVTMLLPAMNLTAAVLFAPSAGQPMNEKLACVFACFVMVLAGLMGVLSALEEANK
jgi:hypothetical protein